MTVSIDEALEQQARLMGQRAARAGKPADSNPYLRVWLTPRAIALREAWDAGYHDAQTAQKGNGNDTPPAA